MLQIYLYSLLELPASRGFYAFITIPENFQGHNIQQYATRRNKLEETLTI